MWYFVPALLWNSIPSICATDKTKKTQLLQSFYTKTENIFSSPANWRWYCKIFLSQHKTCWPSTITWLKTAPTGAQNSAQWQWAGRVRTQARKYANNHMVKSTHQSYQVPKSTQRGILAQQRREPGYVPRAPIKDHMAKGITFKCTLGGGKLSKNCCKNVQCTCPRLPTRSKICWVGIISSWAPITYPLTRTSGEGSTKDSTPYSTSPVDCPILHSQSYNPFPVLEGNKRENHQQHCPGHKPLHHHHQHLHLPPPPEHQQHAHMIILIIQVVLERCTLSSSWSLTLWPFHSFSLSLFHSLTLSHDNPSHPSWFGEDPLSSHLLSCRSLTLSLFHSHAASLSSQLVWRDAPSHLLGAKSCNSQSPTALSHGLAPFVRCSRIEQNSVWKI